MKSNEKRKIIILLSLGIILTLSAMGFCNLSFIAGITDKITEYNDEITLDNENLKFSKLSGKIHIDNNWSDAETALICTGSGTYPDPYVIEDLVIDGGGTGIGIWIQNSVEYFKIENCTIYNSETGISLGFEAHNGTLIDNNCSNNDVGIGMENCKNNTISGNILNNNGDGIHAKNCTEITISGNTADNNSGMGMYLEICRNLDVLDNDVNHNGWVGMWLGEFSDSTVSGNTINYNAEMGGIALGGGRNIISKNIVSYNNYSGIHGGANSNNFSKNTVNYNAEHGISFGGGYSIISETSQITTTKWEFT